MNPLDHLHIPEFGEFITTPSSEACKKIDSTRLLVEVPWGLKTAEGEFGESSLSSRISLDGEFALVVRYRREQDGIENASYASKAMGRYEVFHSRLIGLNKKYFGETKKAA